MKQTEDNTVILLVEITANKHQLKQAVKKLHDTEVTKANALIDPDVEKRAYVPLAPSNVGNKIRMI
jgi:large subunit ribosomal protein L23Ae